VLEDDNLELPEIAQEVDLYDTQAKEVLIFVDGIGVKKQSESRVSKKSGSAEAKSDTENASSRVNSNVVLLETKAGDFEYITSAIDKKFDSLLPLSDIISRHVIQEYGNDVEPLKVVAISDGASVIRTMLMAIFGVLIVIILDWYHLCKKVREFTRQDC
jgi:hypothetical protein